MGWMAEKPQLGSRELDGALQSAKARQVTAPMVTHQQLGVSHPLKVTF